MHGKDLLTIRGGKHGNNITVGNARYDKDTAFITEGRGEIWVGNSDLYGCRIMAEDWAKVSIGNDCDLKGLVIVCRKNSHVMIGHNIRVHGDFWGKTVIHSKGEAIVRIGDDCLLSGNIVIRNNDGHDIIDKGEVQNPPKDIDIRNHVWIGENARILKGAFIGDNCIVGNSSVVTGSLRPQSNVIIAGNPAKVIRHLNQNRDGFGSCPDETWVE